MNEPISPHPVQPSSGRAPFVPNDRELDAIGSLPVLPRLFVAALMAVVATLTGFLGLILVALNHWTAKVVALIVVEPLALFLLCCAVYCLVPTSPLGRLMAATYGRAKVAIWVVMFASALGTVLVLVVFAVSHFGA